MNAENIKLPSKQIADLVIIPSFKIMNDTETILGALLPGHSGSISFGISSDVKLSSYDDPDRDILLVKAIGDCEIRDWMKSKPVMYGCAFCNMIADNIQVVQDINLCPACYGT